MSREKDTNLNSAFESYINTALWSTSNGSGYLDEQYNIEDLDGDTYRDLRLGLELFISKYFDLVLQEDNDSSIEVFAHNLWLTQNGHGAGFWDGDYKNGSDLTTASEDLGEINLYVGDDGKIYK